MTKMVRIENADNNNSHKVQVFRETKNEAGEWIRVVEEPTALHWPTQITTLGIHSHQRLVVEEVPV